jgi:hypothetical protein
MFLASQGFAGEMLNLKSLSLKEFTIEVGHPMVYNIV